MTITIEDIRIGGTVQVQNVLENVDEGGFVIVNAVTYHDLSVFAVGALQVLYKSIH